jgi:hypothetical protein
MQGPSCNERFSAERRLIGTLSCPSPFCGVETSEARSQVAGNAGRVGGCIREQHLSRTAVRYPPPQR